MTELPVTFKDVRAAAACLKGHAIRTPLLRSIELDRETGGRIYVKPECLQLTGSFKFRGAYNRLSRLSGAEARAGVVAWSSGNHGQAVAYAAKLLRIKAIIVMPADAPTVKLEKTRSHGARIVTYDRQTESREDIARAIAADLGAVIVPSFEDPHIIAGQGTAGLEVAEDILAGAGELDAYLTGAGGGGLMAGSAIAIKALMPNTEIWCVEPQDFDDHKRSFAAGKPVNILPGGPNSICDALLAPRPGDMTFAINKEMVSGGVVVSDDEVRSAMRFAMHNLKIVVEPGGAVALAAVLSGRVPVRDRSIGLIVTGGNVDPRAFAKILSAG